MFYFFPTSSLKKKNRVGTPKCARMIDSQSGYRMLIHRSFCDKTFLLVHLRVPTRQEKLGSRFEIRLLKIKNIVSFLI